MVRLFFGELQNEESYYYDQNKQSEEFEIIDFQDPILPLEKPTVAHLCLSSPKDQVCGLTAQDIVLEAAYSNTREYRSKLNVGKSYQDLVHIFAAGYYQPYTIVSCFSDIILETNLNEPLRFPQISETELELRQDHAQLSITNPTRNEILQVSGNQSEYRLQWVDLPQHPMRSPVLGAILLYPQDTGLKSSLNITTCTLGAGWGSSLASVSEAYSDNTFFTNLFDVPKSWPNTVEVVSNVKVTVQSLSNYANLSGYAYPQRKITLLKIGPNTWMPLS